MLRKVSDLPKLPLSLETSRNFMVSRVIDDIYFEVAGIYKLSTSRSHFGLIH